MEGQGPRNSEPAYSDPPLPELWVLRATGRGLSVQAVWGRKGLSGAQRAPSSKQKLMTPRGRPGLRLYRQEMTWYLICCVPLAQLDTLVVASRLPQGLDGLGTPPGSDHINHRSQNYGAIFLTGVV